MTLTDSPPASQNVSPEAEKRARACFDRARTAGDSGNYEYAIEMYVQGLGFHPARLDAHRALREVSLARKARGGKPLGFMERARLKAGKAEKADFKLQMLHAAKLLAYDPGSTDHMAAVAVAAQKSLYYDVVRWIGPKLFRAVRALPRPDVHKLIVLKDVYKNSHEFKLAAEVCKKASALRPQDWALTQELHALEAEQTIAEGHYDREQVFTGSLKDRGGQQRLADEQKDVRSEDMLAAQIREAERVYVANSADPALLKRFVDVLRKTGAPEYENRAIELLDARYEETRQYGYRDQVNAIKLSQLNRLDRSLRDAMKRDEKDPALRKQYQRFLREKTEEELAIYKEKAAAYPTQTEARYEMGVRMFLLGQFEEVIPVFQTVRNDPKLRTKAGISLGRAFFEADFVDEAVDTLGAVISDYVAAGDEKSKDMTYWYARALEKKAEVPSALKSYSQVFQWDAQYRDVGQRIRNLRAAQAGGAPATLGQAPLVSARR